MSGDSKQENWKVVDYSVEPWDLIRLRPLALASIQWRWLMPALLSSFGIIILTYFLGATWFGKTSGLWAAFLIAVHPVDILTSQRIWADDTLVFTCLAALICWCRAKDKETWIWALASGMILGCGILIKQSAVFLPRVP